MALSPDEAEEVFEDAADEICRMDLSTAMEQANMAVNYFFNNRFEEARRLMQPWADRSMYHALGYGTFMFLQAMMTFDPRDIEIASETLKQSVDVCNRQRRRNTIGESLGKMVKKADYNSYLEEEIHAELCYAECLLLRAILSFMEDETLISFLKGSIKIRACYQSYKECWHILEGRDFSKDKHRIHFESGVRMGVGTFNILIAQLPTKILKLLEFVGFSTNKNYGLSELERGFELKGSLRRVSCSLVLLGYHTIAVYAFGTSEGDISKAEKILDDQLQLYPNGVLFLFFHARLQYIKGHFLEAATLYERSRISQSEWKQFHHICYWELFWVSSLRGLYSDAQFYSSSLLEESKWSKATYAYQKSCCMLMKQDSLSLEEKELLSNTMRTIPELKQRIAGKSIPVEKFAIKKSNRFFAQGGTLTLALLELLYVWNSMRILAKSYADIERVYMMADKEIKKLEEIRINERDEYYYDNLLLCHLLKGSSLAYMKSPLQAAEEFKFIINHEKKLKEDLYIVPYALLEVSLLHLNAGDLEQARLILDHTKANYKGYSLESKLHFRIHATLNRIKSIQKTNAKSLLLSKDPSFASMKISDTIIETTAHLNGSSTPV